MSDSRPANASPDLGQFTVIPFRPGRFAGAVQTTLKRTDSLQVTRDSITSSFVLELLPDGTASLCRGWQYRSSSDGPNRHSLEHLREQLGYVGRWADRDNWGTVDLHRDEAACQDIGEYTQLVPNHADQWSLRCVAVTKAGGDGPLGQAVLACQLSAGTPQFGEDAPHVISGILPGSWILLAENHGLRIRSSAQAVGSTPATPTIQIEPSPVPVQASSWTESF